MTRIYELVMSEHDITGESILRPFNQEIPHVFHLR